MSTESEKELDHLHSERRFYLHKARLFQKFLEGVLKNLKSPSFNRKMRDGHIKSAKKLFPRK